MEDVWIENEIQTHILGVSSKIFTTAPRYRTTMRFQKLYRNLTYGT